MRIDRLWRLCTHVSEPIFATATPTDSFIQLHTTKPKMTSLLKLQPRLRASVSLTNLSRPTFNTTARRTLAQKTSTPQGEQGQGSTKTGQQESDAQGNHPIPSNKAQPTLRDGNQSPMADEDGNLRDDLPHDVKQHNEEMEERYDRPYNHISDEGEVAPAWKRK